LIRICISASVGENIVLERPWPLNVVLLELRKGIFNK